MRSTSRAADTNVATLTELKQRMANAYPDRGGTSEAFQEAHRRYTAARNRAA